MRSLYCVCTSRTYFFEPYNCRWFSFIVSDSSIISVVGFDGSFLFKKSQLQFLLVNIDFWTRKVQHVSNTKLSHSWYKLSMVQGSLKYSLSCGGTGDTLATYFKLPERKRISKTWYDWKRKTKGPFYFFMNCLWFEYMFLKIILKICNIDEIQ